MTDVAVINCGIGNIRNLCRAVRMSGNTPHVTADPSDLSRFTHAMLPGVGAFPEMRRRMDELGLVEPLCDRVADGKLMLLGICLGMQMLADAGEEQGGAEGLGLIPGRVVPLPATERIPHVGWNDVSHDGTDYFMMEVPDKADFYFVHGYHFQAERDEHVIGVTDYATRFPAIVGNGTVYGTQFHPEISGPHGLKLLENFLRL